MDEPVQPIGPVVDLLIDRANGGEEAEAGAALEFIVREHGSLLSDDKLHALARLDPAPAGLGDAVEREMRRRGIWRAFRRGERRRVWRGGIRSTVQILLLAAALLAAFFGVIIGAARALHWLGFW